MVNFIKKLFTSSPKNKQDIWLGRNDPCWCGSGKKYKKCHLQADEPLRQQQRPSCSVKG